MPKRSPSGGRDGGRTAKRRRQHLYLVFDDWSWGYSVRKIDLSSDTDSEGSEPRLPRAVFRLETRHEFPQHITAAFGTKIIAMPLMMYGAMPSRMFGSMPPEIDGTDSPRPLPIDQVGRVTVFDVRSRGLTFAPQPEVVPVHPIYFPIGDRLFVLSSNSFQVLYPPSVCEQHGPCWEGSWRKLPMHPFEGNWITSYAVHPDGRTIFVSIKEVATSTVATYMFDTAEPRCGWKKQGNWALPFTGRAHFDSKLEAWVGLTGDPGTAGCLCACDVVSAKSDGGDGNSPSWKWKLCKIVLYSENPLEEHVGASLVFMGSKFCLVQCVSINNAGVERSPFDEPRLSDCLFRLTTFSLKFNNKGELTSGNSRRVRYYKAPKDAVGYTLTDPLAFWL